MDFLTFEQLVKDGLSDRFGIAEEDIGQWELGRKDLMDAFTDGKKPNEYLNELKERFDWGETEAADISDLSF